METHSYKTKLEEERATIVSELEALGTYNKESNTWETRPESYDENGADDNSNADRFESFEEDSATMKPLVARLDEIDRALAMIETNTYGTCEVCGNEIEEARLNANPAASTCTAHMQ